MDYGMKTHRDRVNISHYENLIFPCSQKNSRGYLIVYHTADLFLCSSLSRLIIMENQTLVDSFFTEKNTYIYIYRVFICTQSYRV